MAARPCSDCTKYLYHDQGRGKFGLRVERQGKPVLRPKGVGTPCGMCPKIPSGAPPRPENAIELSAKNVAAYCHYLECKATRDFPSDAIVKRNAALFAEVEDTAKQVEQQRFGLTVLSNLAGAQS